MAIISVIGVAERIFYNNCGVEVVEQVMTQAGETITKRYSAWFSEPVNFAPGTSGKFSGLLSARIEDWVDKEGNPKLDKEGKQGRSVRLSINNTKFKPIDDTLIQPKDQHGLAPDLIRSSATADSWTPPLTTNFDEVAPF